MTRIAVAGLVVVGLALGIWILWPDGDAASDTATTIATASATTTTMPAGTTSSRPVTTTGGVPDSPVVETVEEAEQILRELWFGWFEGIYNQDEERIREVVVLDSQVQAGIDAFGSNFAAKPTRDGIELMGVEILRSDEECLATWSSLDITIFRGPDALAEGVVVARRVQGEWKVLSNWVHRDDLWEADCDASL